MKTIGAVVLAAFLAACGGAVGPAADAGDAGSNCATESCASLKSAAESGNLAARECFDALTDAGACTP